MLHPERDSLETIQDVRAEVGEYNFESQYQQSPKPLDGGVIKKSRMKYFELTDTPQKFDLKIQSWDTANKVGELNDYSVCSTWGMYDDRIYLLDLTVCV